MPSAIGNATAALAIGLNVFNSYLQRLHALGAFAFEGTLPPGSPFGNIAVSVDVNPAPQFGLATEPNGNLYVRLSLQGTVVPSEGPQVPLPFSSAVRVEFALDSLQSPQDAPALVSRYAGVDVPPPPLTAAQFEALLQSAGIPAKLSLRFDTLLPTLVSQLEPELYDEGRAPQPSLWNYQLELREARANRGAAVAVFLAAPLSMHQGPLTPMSTLPPSHSRGSFLPSDLGFGVVIGDTGIDRIFTRQAHARIGSEINGATIRSLEMTLADNTRIHVKGRATKTGVDITWEGPIGIELRRGAPDWSVDAAGVVTNVDRAWWVVFLEVGGIGILSLPVLIYVESEIGGAPGQVRSGFSDIMKRTFGELAAGLSVTQRDTRLAVTSTVSEGRIINNAINVFANVLVDAVVPNLRGGWHSNVGLTFDITQPSRTDNAFSLDGERAADGGRRNSRWRLDSSPLDRLRESVQCARQGRDGWRWQRQPDHFRQRSGPGQNTGSVRSQCRRPSA